MQQYPEYTRKRIRQLIDRVQAAIYPHKRPVRQVLVAGPVDRISRQEAHGLKYRPARLGQQFGPLWATFWFKLRARVPREWAGQRVDLLWVSHSEATLWLGGRAVQGLNHEPESYDRSSRPDAVLLPRARGGEMLDFHVEMACNKVFGDRYSGGFRSVSPYVLDQCDIAVFDPQAWELYYDMLVLQELEANIAKDNASAEKTWAGEILYELNRAANLLDPADRATWAPARRIVKALYSRRNATQVHELSAVGHAHIDTAWLWPLAETHRKCERTFSSQVSYMEQYPDLVFACSQAYQYSAVKERNPDLYRRVKVRVAKGQFLPVGGTWVEPDCNIPSGESLVRQFLYGQRFFRDEFGILCKEFWNPDVFGYNGQLPQIMRLAGIARFLTQKLSWNRFNKPRHHTFTWQGIDGSEVLAHFPPADTYNGMADVGELRRNMREYKDHDRSRHSLLLFGHGDGGGGPTRRMLEVLRRARDLQGLPRTRIRTTDAFFELLEKDCTDRPTMVGELYFELHRGTYTTQAANKRGNRKGELLMHDVEFLSALATRLGGHRYPARDIERLWKLLLVNQFHDILPGSSITEVYEDSARDYAQVQQLGQDLRQRAASALLNGRRSSLQELVPVNTIGFDRREVAELPDGRLAFVAAPSCGVGRIVSPNDQVSITEPSRNRIVLENMHLRAALSSDGRLLSLYDKHARREALDGPGNLLKLYDDHPTAFDAWDVDPFHLETERDAERAGECRVVTRSPLRAEVRFGRKVGARSRMTQLVRLDADARRLEFHCDADWREDHTMLKVVFPVNVRAMNATYEMQFGCIERPTHFNTTHDLARFEVPGHKWADLSEHGFGVSLLTDCKYGYSAYGNQMRISLLRSPTSPDPKADRGRHAFAYAIVPHAGAWREAGIVAEALRFNCPLVWVASGRPAAGMRSFASVDDANLVLDTIKKAEDSDALVVRLYEAHGARGTARLKLDVPFKSAAFCNILEEEQSPASAADGLIAVPYGPYQIISLLVR